jgi:hypothetical protein
MPAYVGYLIAALYPASATAAAIALLRITRRRSHHV